MPRQFAIFSSVAALMLAAFYLESRCQRNTSSREHSQVYLADPSHRPNAWVSTRVLDKQLTNTANTCDSINIVYPEWPDGFNPNVRAVFLVGEQKSGTTWLWELLRYHPCIIPPVRPARKNDAITIKETYYFTSTHISGDAREFLLPWLPALSGSEHVADLTTVADDWLDQSLQTSDLGTTVSTAHLHSQRTYTSPVPKLTGFQECKQYYILEATPHNLHTPIAAARIKKLFPDAKILVLLKDPVDRVMSAYSQFSKQFKEACHTAEPAAWCPVFRYYRLRMPSFLQMVQDDITYLKSRGCAFQNESQNRTWMECFGCEMMDPWQYRRPGSEVQRGAYAPSLALSMYAPMLKTFMEYFNSSMVQVLNYEGVVDDVQTAVNNVLHFLDLELYNKEHWRILNPEGLGFKGSKSVTDFADTLQQLSAIKKELYAFFQPINLQLEIFLKAHDMPWKHFEHMNL